MAKKKAIRLNRKKAIHDSILNQAELSNEALIEGGLLPDVRVKFKKYKGDNKVNVKEDYDFNKIFRVDFRTLILNEGLSKNARCIIGTLGCFVDYPSNEIRINGKNPSLNDLGKLVKMSKATLLEALKELEYHELIKRCHLHGQYIIYFNPFLICVGLVAKETCELFKDSVYNPNRHKFYTPKERKLYL
jgi:hypothetical protein